ncbi:alpha-hydroxy acid oxidase [Streptomyces chartreusis]|uniref:alpha-hydroxy acid oxidase n=1 Tax=Streptomyces chartreusis TaxID=1969 RepID=UPI00362D4FF3
MSERSVARKLTSVLAAQHHMERRLPRFLVQRYEGGSGRAVTLRRNVEAFDEVTFLPRVARDFGARRLDTTVLGGTKLSMPVMIAPTGGLAIGHWDGERAMARAAGEAGTAMVVSSSTGTAIEEVAAAAQGPVLFQLHHLYGRENSARMIERARASGCTALMFTVDARGGGPRERHPRETAFAPTSFSPAELLRAAPQTLRRPRWLWDFLRHRAGLTVPMAPLKDGRPLSVFKIMEALSVRPAVWEDVDWIRDHWDGPLIIKGIITVEDAHRAVALGSDGIVVSNHGALGLDGVPATITALPSIVDAVGSRTEVWFDGGVRRGADVVKAMALGAKGVLIGRAAIYGLMAAGEPGVRQILEVFRQGMAGTLLALGCESFEDLTRDHVRIPADWTA